jgi:endonuclease/exonuclease/phosphatase (EEP) superfamily protein YafD
MAMEQRWMTEYGRLESEVPYRVQVFVQAETFRRIKVLREVSVNTGTSRIPHTTPRGAVIRAAQCQRYQTS